MTPSDFNYLLPLIILAAMSVLIISAIAVRRNHLQTVLMTAIAFAAALISLLQCDVSHPHLIAPLFVIDRYALYFLALLYSAGLLLTFLAYDYLKNLDLKREEYYVLLLLATLGSSVLIISRHFVSFFLGLEILGVALYTLIAYVVDRKKGSEAGIKYLILAAAASAFLLFGMALIYFGSGTMEFVELSKVLISGINSPIIYPGIALMIVGVGFKLAVVPFHMWTADVYEGAPAPVTAFIATVSKGSMFALILRFFTPMDIIAHNALFLIFAIVSVASMFTGNILALMQNNLKRILAYSSIAHLGYLLVAFLAGNTIGLSAVAFYLLAYFVTIIGAFAVISVLSGREGESVALEDYRSLYWRHPWLAAMLTTFMFSLAGIPLTAGFIAKFYILIAGIKASLWVLVFMLVINSAISVYYYLRVIMAMFSKSDTETEKTTEANYVVPTLSGLVLAVLMFVLIWAGVYPGHLIDAIQSLASGLVSNPPQAGMLFP